MATESTIKPRRIGAQELRLGRCRKFGRTCTIIQTQTTGQRARIKNSRCINKCCWQQQVVLWIHASKLVYIMHLHQIHSDQ